MFKINYFNLQSSIKGTFDEIVKLVFLIVDRIMINKKYFKKKASG
jgi:hypothetical protein